MLSPNHIIHLWVPNAFEFKGGIQVYLQDVLSALATEFPERQFHVFDKLDKRKPFSDRYGQNWSFSFSGVAPTFLQTAYFTLSLILGTILKRPNLILCCHINFAWPIVYLNRLFGIPYWIMTYGIDVWNIQDPCKIQALRKADKVIAIGTYTRDRLVKEQNLSPDKILLLPVTFNNQRWKIASKPDYLLQRYQLTAEQPTILTVARLDRSERYKGYDQILQALPKIRDVIPNVHYIMVGKGSDRPRIEQLITDLNLHDCVTLTGFVTDEELCDHYNLCDVFAMPSKSEGFGIVYLEALACGKPCLGGNQDGAIDALLQGELGALVDPDSIDEIAQTLILLLQGSYPNPLFYKPQELRNRVVYEYGFAKFKRTLKDYLS